MIEMGGVDMACVSDKRKCCPDDETCCLAYRQETCKKCRYRLEPTNDCVCS